MAEDSAEDDRERGERIRELRRQRRLSQRAVADMVGVSERAVQTWEAGGNISWPNLVQLARILGVTPNELVFGAINEPEMLGPAASLEDRVRWLEGAVGARVGEHDRVVCDAFNDVPGRVAALEQAVDRLTQRLNDALLVLGELRTGQRVLAEGLAALTGSCCKGGPRRGT